VVGLGVGRARAGGWSLAWMADPGRFQLVFTGLYAIDVGVRVAFGSWFGFVCGPGFALMSVPLLLVVGLAVPWDRLDPRMALVLPIADIAIIGASRLAPEGGNGLLAVFPALWLGRQWGRFGAVVAGAATVLFLVLPGAVYTDWDAVLLVRTLFIALVVLVTALVIADGMEQVRVQAGTIEHQRRVSQAIFDTVDVGLLLLDRDGQYVGMNRRHQEFMTLGYPDGHSGRAGQLGHVFDEDGRTPMAREQMPAYRATAGEEFDDLRMWIGADPASRRALSVSARVVRSDSGAFAGAALGYTDVTDFMRALRVKDEFVALVSHELRTPLTSIVGYVQILEEDGAVPPHAVDQLRVVHRNAERLRRLIGDLLDTAQRDGSPMPINRSSADLSAIVTESVEAARPVADAAGVELVLSAPDDLRLSLDAQRIAQVVDNLLSNAIKYTERGGQVTVQLGTDEGWVDLRVADTGIGIAPDDCLRLFARFFRTEDAARRAVAGAGLGLSITKDIVESHGGRITVESEVGRGSVFRVLLPL
jgi:two-component system phosphate regulon sensor histidine kinase PhoR